jgi:hypothetical protein
MLTGAAKSPITGQKKYLTKQLFAAWLRIRAEEEALKSAPMRLRESFAVQKGRIANVV